MRYVVYGLLLLLYVLHTDVWYWNDSRIVLGLPIGITYHVLWTLMVTGAFGLAVRHIWPDELEAAEPGAPGAPGTPAESDKSTAPPPSSAAGSS